MTVSKRTRFEILRRDENTCQYCGQMAPDVPLHIDHVIPISLGGSDDPSNLVTACRDCNTGKASISPDSPIVAAVAEKSAEFALAQANRAAHIESDLLAISDYRAEFEDTWNAWSRPQGDERMTMPLPDDWRRSLAAWWRMSVPLALLLDAVPTAMTSKGKNQAGIPDRDRFRYFAGIVWRTLEEYEATYPQGVSSGRVYSEQEREDYGISQWQEGTARAKVDADLRALKVAHEMHSYMTNKASSLDFVRHHIDGTARPKHVVRTFFDLAGVR